MGKREDAAHWGEGGREVMNQPVESNSVSCFRPCSCFLFHPLTCPLFPLFFVFVFAPQKYKSFPLCNLSRTSCWYYIVGFYFIATPLSCRHHLIVSLKHNLHQQRHSLSLCWAVLDPWVFGGDIQVKSREFWWICKSSGDNLLIGFDSIMTNNKEKVNIPLQP